MEKNKICWKKYSTKQKLTKTQMEYYQNYTKWIETINEISSLKPKKLTWWSLDLVNLCLPVGFHKLQCKICFDTIGGQHFLFKCKIFEEFKKNEIKIDWKIRWRLWKFFWELKNSNLDYLILTNRHWKEKKLNMIVLKFLTCYQ
mgnify:CR=1 FL=1